MNINDTGLTNNPDNLRELARDPEHLKKLVALWADNTFVHHLAAELLAVREAQNVPVAYRYRYNRKYLASTGCGDMVSSWKYCEEAGLVNPDERYERQELFTAPPAPALPNVISASNAPELFEIAAEVEKLGLNGAYGSYAVGWNACRAAMLKREAQHEQRIHQWRKINEEGCQDYQIGTPAQSVPAGKFAGWGLYHAERDEFGGRLKATPEADNSHAITTHGYVNVKLYTAPPVLTGYIPPAKPLPDVYMAAYHEAMGWNACRAAMLNGSGVLWFGFDPAKEGDNQ